MMLFVRGYLPI